MPIPFSKTGGYEINGKQGQAFRGGDIRRRQNGQNETLSYAQRSEVLARHDDLVKRNERSVVDELIKAVTASLSSVDKLPPLEIGMPENALFISLLNCFENNGSARIRRYCTQLYGKLAQDKDYVFHLAAVACFAAMYRDIKTFNEIVELLYAHFLSIDKKPSSCANDKLTLAIALYVIGSAAVRSQLWSVISPLVNKQSQGGHRYASWSKACQIMASQMNLLGSNGSPFLITLTLEEMHQRKTLRPDVQVKDSDDWEIAKELLLNSLCSFDFLYCACVYVEGEGHGDAYPACVEFNEERIKNVLNGVLTPSSSLANELFKKPVDEAGKTRLRGMFEIIRTQALQHNNWFFDVLDEDLIEQYFG